MTTRNFAALLCTTLSLAAFGARAGAKDLGPSAKSEKITTAVFLNVTDPAGLASYAQATVTPGDWRYHRFLSTAQFADKFAPTQHQVNQVVNYLQSYGITVDEVYADRLAIVATGTADQFNQAYSITLHQYQAHGTTFRAPSSALTFPPALQGTVMSVAGLSTQVRFHSHVVRAPHAVPQKTILPVNNTSTGVPGNFTVGDAAGLYQVNDLYKLGIDGTGSTIGIATLADFTKSDATTYWKQIGLKVKGDRISKVAVLGGGPSGADSGSDETTLDVEQSGGLAPGANIIVYDAPQTDAGFIALFYKAMSDNLVDSLSTSWGGSEADYFNSGLTGADLTWEMNAMDQAFLEGAAQGISIFAAAGDDGAYDTTSQFGPQVGPFLSVDVPGSDPMITCAGGTTIAATFPVSISNGVTTANGTITIPQERPWGWDYFNPFLVANFGPDYNNGFFSVGGGGGVSSYWPLPAYQEKVSGVTATQPNQSAIYYPNYPDLTGAEDLLDLPAGFAGRNVPDLSLNADPYTGYLLYWTGDSTEPAWSNGNGGTSFVAPQLNGITALIDSAEGRVGFLNPVIYRLLHQHNYGRNGAFNDVTTGDNWFYVATQGYDEGVGIGTVNAANLATAIFLDGFGF